MSKKVTKAKSPKVLDRKHYVAAAKARWDGERERRILKTAEKVEAILEKNAKLPAKEVSVLIAKALMSKKK